MRSAHSMGVDGITDVEGVRVGHYTDLEAATGCTVVLCEAGAVGGVDVRGSSPGTAETDVLRPLSRVQEVHGVLLSGGSAFGLGASSGVVRYLEEREVGHSIGNLVVPIVPAAILFDLGIVTSKVRPGPEDGYAACAAASSGPTPEGTVGAGTGATVGKLLGLERALKGGIGTASVNLGDGVFVGAIVAVNAIGGIVDPGTGSIVAGPRDGEGGMHDSVKLITSPGFEGVKLPSAANTTIGVVATSTRLDKIEANKLADVAHDGIALAVRPAHMMGDGDTMFAIGTGASEAVVGMDRLCAAATLSVSEAIVRAVRAADGIGGIPSVSEMEPDGAL